MKIWRSITVIFLTLVLSFTTIACSGQATQNIPPAKNVVNTVQTTNVANLNDGQYPVQQATYNDTDGEYTLFLLGATPPTLKTEKLQMARLTDDEIKQGKKTYLKVENKQPILYLTEDFKIEYVHSVTETKTNPETGQQEKVVVRRENGFWAPFAGAVAGQAIGSLLFQPHYYVPPAYQPGVVLNGYGGYGRSYNDAVVSYRDRYNTQPPAVQNRTAFRSTGSIRNTYPSGSTINSTPRTTTGNRATGSGFGSNTLRSSGRTSTIRRPSTSSFGSGRSMRRTSGFGSRRR